MQKNQIKFFLGSEIYSQFRKQALEKKIKNLNPEILSIESIYSYVIESSETLSSIMQEKLEKILGYEPNKFSDFKIKNSLFVGPRVGTI